MRDTFLSFIRYTCGDLRKVSELAGTTTEDLSPLVAEIVHFRESSQDIWEMAAAAAEQTLADAAAPPDFVVYVSENDPDVAGSLGRILDRLGLVSVAHLAVSGQDCGNLAPAVQVASDAIHSGRCDRVLLVLADRAASGRRVMASGLSVFSDGAAACVITRDPVRDGPQFRVVGTGSRTAIRLDAGGTAEQGILATVRLASESIADLLGALGRGRDDFPYVVMPNYRPDAQKFLMAAMKMPVQKLLLGPVTDLGHCFSADTLITLHQQAASGTLTTGDRLLVATSGPHSWSTMAVECL
ncbi:hypothetical protein [Streptomyces caeruleatus]|uniref:Beta-ketoacyl-[acyl-carrier-protein] synthase III N-terminal domain-containing protein n=1 Tax=Streptomyces caeruleatus TaxID=661399 RepID=A0A117RKE8_9ACTN|nr:hypothetical protein [Streptomyces caeruleatus]KUN95685.1 hypothetical protein AQJ67_34570 [Streptomyces caeruleatus]